MSNRRGKLDIPYLAIFSVILIVAVIASLLLFPEWRESPATMVVLLVAAVGGVVGLAANFRQAFIHDKDDAPPATLDYDSPQHRRNQENVCANVRSAWIDGVLRESLPERVRLALGLDSLPEMVQRHLVHVTGRTARRERVSEVHLSDLFRAAGRALLILGAPGSGKTVTLLELCEPILEGAEADPRRPVPVVLNLSTWSRERAPLQAWIIEEMSRQYGLNRRVTPVWLAADHLILLLDGLDEVASDARDACVRAINAFREQYGAGIAVCSRSADYAELSEQLALSQAVEIRPLSPEQVDEYLSDERLGLAAARQAIAQDDALRKLSTTPLLLNVMAVAYRGLPFDALLPLLGSPIERRAHLYDAYIARVFAHRPLPDGGAAQALRWLRFLAQRLTERSETQFFIEDMQPDWLPGRRGCWVGGLAGVLAGGLAGGLAGVLLGVLSIVLQVARITVLSDVLFQVLGGVLLGVPFGVLAGGLVGVLTASDNIRSVDELAWELSPSAIGRLVKDSLLFGVLSGVLIGVMSGVIEGGLVDGVVSGLFGVLTIMLTAVLFHTLRQLESKRRDRPNQGIRRSALNALRGGVLFGVLFGVLSGLVGGLVVSGRSSVLISRLGDALLGGLVGVLFGGIFGGLLYGGAAVIKHYILRALLALHHLLPLRLIPFLEAMRERILLQRAGAHYRFIHRTLQEHIAALSDERIEALTR